MADITPYPATFVIPPTSFHTHTIILLHGRGSSGAEFADEFFQGESFAPQPLSLSFPTIKWVFPSAHRRFSTVFEQEMNEWFDIYSTTDPYLREDLQLEGLKQSVALIHRVVVAEATILGPGGRERIILGGISQGCALAMTCFLTGLCGIGGLMAFNGWMPLMGLVKDAISATSFGLRRCQQLAPNLRARVGLEGKAPFASVDLTLGGDMQMAGSGHAHTPILLTHTVDDDVIDIALGKQMRNTLIGIGVNRVMWKQHQTGGHWIAEPAGYQDIEDFLKQIIGPNNDNSRGEDEK